MTDATAGVHHGAWKHDGSATGRRSLDYAGNRREVRCIARKAGGWTATHQHLFGWMTLGIGSSSGFLLVRACSGMPDLAYVPGSRSASRMSMLRDEVLQALVEATRVGLSGTSGYHAAQVQKSEIWYSFQSRSA
jgi:hypothetical protein